MTQISTVPPDDTDAPAAPPIDKASASRVETTQNSNIDDSPATIAPSIPTTASAESSAPLVESYFQSATWKLDFRIFSAYAKSNLGLRGQAIKLAWAKGLEYVANDALQDQKKRSRAASLLQNYRKNQQTGRKPGLDLHISDSASDTSRSQTCARSRPSSPTPDEMTPNAKRPCLTRAAVVRQQTPERGPANMDEISLSPSNKDVPASAPRYKFTCSGRYLYFKASASAVAVESQQGTIRLDDPEVSRSLSVNEMAELNKLAHIPQLSDGFRHAISRFTPRPTSMAELRAAVYTPPFGVGEAYSREKHADACYVNDAVCMIMSVMESLSTSSWMGPQGLREGWYGANIWAPLIDRCFHTIQSCVLARTEIKSRVDDGANRRFDGIICGLVGHAVAEFGAIEVAKDAEAVSASKTPKDREKLIGVMESMLKALLETVEWDMSVGRSLCVVGIQHVGYTIRVLRMQALKSDVFVVHPGNVRVVPTQMDRFDDLLDVMRSIITAKNIVARSMQTVIEYRRGKLAPVDPDDPDEGFVL